MAKLRSLLIIFLLPITVKCLTCYSCGTGICPDPWDASSSSTILSSGGTGCNVCYKAVDRTSLTASRSCVTTGSCPTIYNADVYCCTDRLCNNVGSPKWSPTLLLTTLLLAFVAKQLLATVVAD